MFFQHVVPAPRRLILPLMTNGFVIRILLLAPIRSELAILLSCCGDASFCYKLISCFRLQASIDFIDSAPLDIHSEKWFKAIENGGDRFTDLALVLS